MISAEQYLGLRTTLVGELTDDWSPHVSIIAHINRTLCIEDLDFAIAGTLAVLKRLIEEGILAPGEIDLDSGRFSNYRGSKEEVWEKVERQIPAGHRAIYDFHLWFDLGPMASSERKGPNKALEPTTMAVTARAPSSTSRASHGRGSS